MSWLLSPAAATISLSQLGDVTITSIQTDDVISWSGSAWVNGPASGGIDDGTINLAPLVWDNSGGNWVESTGVTIEDGSLGSKNQIIVGANNSSVPTSAGLRFLSANTAANMIFSDGDPSSGTGVKLSSSFGPSDANHSFDITHYASTAPTLEPNIQIINKGEVWLLNTWRFTETAFTGPGLLADGTVTDAVLRWDGSDWVEEADVRIYASGRVDIRNSIVVDLTDNDNALNVGGDPSVGAHLACGPNTIQAKVGAISGAALKLNPLSGGVEIGEQTAVAGAGMRAWHAGLEVMRTINRASGGVEVDNRATASGFERVLTLSDKITKVGTPADNEVAVWTGDGTIEGASALTWDGSALATTGIVSLPAGTESLPSLAFTGDVDTGIYSPGANIFAITVGGSEAVRYTGTASHLEDHTLADPITASTTQTQGQEPLTSSYNNVDTVANNNDVVTMPTAVSGRYCLVINTGANKLQLFPASGDDLGAGVDTSTTIKSNTSLLFIGLNTTSWHDIATKLESLQGVDLTGAADNDLFYRAGGDWQDTGGNLTWDGSKLTLKGTLFIEERAAAIADVAGFGQLWVKNTTPCELWFTDDAGTATQIV